MTFWELFGALMSAAGLVVGGLGFAITYAARRNGEATRALIRELHGDTQATIRSMEERMTRHFSEVLERMDQRADERHREVLALMQRLRPA